MGYPVAYRTQTARSYRSPGGFQNLGNVAEQVRRSMGLPANDPRHRRLPPRVQPKVPFAKPLVVEVAKRAVPVLRNVHPALRLASLIYEIATYESPLDALVPAGTVNEKRITEGWTQTGLCRDGPEDIIAGMQSMACWAGILIPALSPAQIANETNVSTFHRTGDFGYPGSGIPFGDQIGEYAKIDPNAEPFSLPTTEEVPVFLPVVAPATVPYWAIPYRVDHPLSARSNGTQKRQKDPPTYTATKEGIKSSPTNHKRKPPDETTVEKKATLGAGGKWISKLFHNITEANDYLDAVGEAMDEKAYNKQKGYGRKWAWVFDELTTNPGKYANSLTAANVVLNLVKNHYEDKLIGGLNAAAQRNLPGRKGLPIGTAWGGAI